MVLPARHARRLGPPALLIALWAVVLWHGPLADVRITDVYVYDGYARALAQGLHPYSSAFPLEYPPLALAPIWLARALGGDGHYEVWFGVLMGAAALATQAGVRALGGARAAWLFALTPLLCAAVVRTHYDLVVAALLVAALATITRRPALGFALLGLGAMAKGFPAVVVPVAAAWLVGRGAWREAAKGIGVFVLVCAAISAPFLGQGYVDAYRFHLDRPIQVEATPAVLAYALGGAHVTGSATVADAFKSNGLRGGATDVLEPLFAVLLLLALALLAWLAALRDDERHLLLCASAAVIAFVALGKVLSPQYVAWLAPLAAVLAVRRARLAAGLLTLGIVLTTIEFPRRYAALVEAHDGVRVLVGVRDAAFVAALIATAAAAARSPRPAAAPPRSAPARP